MISSLQHVGQLRPANFTWQGMCTVNQLIKGSMRKAPMCALLMVGVAFLLGCGSEPAEPLIEAGPAPAAGAVNAPELETANQPGSSEPADSQAMPEYTSSQTMPAYDSSMPAVAPSASIESGSEADSGDSTTGESLVEPAAPLVETSGQSDLFVERDAIDALSEDLFLEIISPTEEVVFVESATFLLTARTVIDAAVSVNDDLVEVNEEGILEAELTLEEGPNLVEVVASTAGGDELSAVLTIFYLP